MLMIAPIAVMAWLLIAVIVGVGIGVRLHSWLHYRRLRGILCQRCLNGFWTKYREKEIEDAFRE